MSFILSFLPWTGLATLFAAIFFAKKASTNKALADRLAWELSEAKSDLAKAVKQIEQMGENYRIVDERREDAELRSFRIQNAAQALARQIAESKNAEAAARELAEKLKETLNG